MKNYFGRLPILFISLLIVASLVACGDNKVSDTDEFRLVKMNSYKGNVSLNRDGDKADIFEGIQLLPEDNVTTESESICELLVDSDKHIIATANTSFNVNAAGNDENGKVTLKTNYGEILIAIDNKLNDNSEFIVDTPNAILSVRGTIFNVYCDTAGKTAIIVTEGTVWATDLDETNEVVIEAGNGAIITEDEITTGTIDEIINEVPDVAIDEESEKLLIAVRPDIDNDIDAEPAEALSADSDMSLASVGDTVLFGTYNYGFSNGEEPVEWDVLDVQEDKVLLISHYVIGTRAYDQAGVDYADGLDTNWADSEMRAYLNSDIYNRFFTADEQAQILTSTITNPSSSEFYAMYKPNETFVENTNPCGDTEDKLFLLSLEELEKYYTITIDDDGSHAYDAVAARRNDVDVTWSLRSACFSGGSVVATLNPHGRFDGSGVGLECGVRPAMWVER